MQLRYCYITAAAAAPAAAAALALAVIATIFGTYYAAAYTSPVVPTVAVTPVAYTTKLPQLLYTVKISLIMILSLPPDFYRLH